uniref:PHD-type domain-containing protein n=1 Tax=Rhabditophanes sp. KR3021 TaxID=114890 RepID=A0AC35UCN0_9BILA
MDDADTTKDAIIHDLDGNKSLEKDPLIDNQPITMPSNIGSTDIKKQDISLIEPMDIDISMLGEDEDTQENDIKRESVDEHTIGEGKEQAISEEEQVISKEEEANDEDESPDQNSQSNSQENTPLSNESVKKEPSNEINDSAVAEDILKPDEVAVSDLYKSPLMSEIIVFYNTFGSLLNNKPVTFEKFEKLLTTFDDKGRVDKELILLQISLIRRGGNPAAKPEKFESAIHKLIQHYPTLFEIRTQLEEIVHYSLLPIESKLLLWKHLCLAQFDYNNKFKEALSNTLDFHQYKFAPIGSDKNNKKYWFAVDSDYCIRMFVEDIKDEYSSHFSLAAQDEESLKKVIESLKVDNIPGKEIDFVKANKKHTYVSEFLSIETIANLKKEKREKKNVKKPVVENIEPDLEAMSQEDEVEEAIVKKELPSRTSKSAAGDAIKAVTADIDEDEPIDSEDDEAAKPSTSKKGAKRGRKKGFKLDKQTPSKSKSPIEEEYESDEEIEVKERKQATLETLCMQCNKSKNPGVLLLCDLCDDPWHIYCCTPRLYVIPEGDWWCQKCNHHVLVNRLEKLLLELQERNETKKKDLAKKAAQADSLKRELALIHLQLNNLQPASNTRRNVKKEVSEESEDDGTIRRSKKVALKKVCRNPPRSSYAAAPTIAETRTRRSTRQIDYKKFTEYDEELDDIEEPEEKPAKRMSKKKNDDDDYNEASEDDEEEDEYVGPRSRKDDNEFINDSDSDYNPGGRRSARRPPPRRKTTKKRRGGSSEDEVTEDDDYEEANSNKRKRKAPARANHDFDDSDFEVSATGRTVRKAARIVYKELSVEDEEEEIISPAPKRRAVGFEMKKSAMPSLPQLAPKSSTTNNVHAVQSRPQVQRQYPVKLINPPNNMSVFIPKAAFSKIPVPELNQSLNLNCAYMPPKRNLPQQQQMISNLPSGKSQMVQVPPPRRINSPSSIGQNSPAYSRNLTAVRSIPHVSTPQMNPYSSSMQQPIIYAPQHQPYVMPAGYSDMQCQPMPYESSSNGYGSTSSIPYPGQENWAEPWQLPAPYPHETSFSTTTYTTEQLTSINPSSENGDSNATSGEFTSL